MSKRRRKFLAGDGLGLCAHCHDTLDKHIGSTYICSRRSERRLKTINAEAAREDADREPEYEHD